MGDRAAIFGLAAALTLAGGAGHAADIRDGFGPGLVAPLPAPPYGYDGAFADAGLVPGRPATRLQRSRDYSGTEYGLGRPSFYGMAPRPDWGRSSID